ncbi:DUF4169 family protein [Frigidibacter sp. RF13]|uniref:DUF4169 family protein n=1 Tax=Frigidibacter sp. RF13 TaxID=2997340 RepID=UPI00226EFEC9|nr:DUF4169 family protein [Frigidibacter sp. RF13]MCY1125507.1 DUF4169 family protein [Frigidibacter sp. RF13]
MAEVVNLRTKRKQAARAAARESSAENAARHGETKAARDRYLAEAEKAVRHLDQHRRDSGADSD